MRKLARSLFFCHIFSESVIARSHFCAPRHVCARALLISAVLIQISAVLALSLTFSSFPRHKALIPKYIQSQPDWKRACSKACETRAACARSHAAMPPGNTVPRPVELQVCVSRCAHACVCVGML